MCALTGLSILFNNYWRLWVLGRVVEPTRLLLVLIIILTVSSSQAMAQTAQDEEWRKSVPDVLQPWIPWVTRDLDLRRDDCLTAVAARNNPFCVWLPKVRVVLDSKSGEVQLEVQVDSKKEFVVLPGSAATWPIEARTGDTARAILDRNGVPVVELPRGAHRLSVFYQWSSMPGAFPTPRDTAILSLQVMGKDIPFPKRQANGYIWTDRVEEVAPTQQISDRIEMEVFRHIVDGIPQHLETVMSMRVSGKMREVSIPKNAFQGTIFSVSSPLPVQVQADSVAIQVKPGIWTIKVSTWLETLQDKFSIPTDRAPWPDSEVWALQSFPELRTIEFRGGQPISIEQTNAPKEWRNFSLVILGPKETLEIVELRRGGTRAARDALNLQRQMWLGFDGAEFTVRDVISGTISEAGRLEYLQGGKLGRVSINGVDQYITQLEDSETVGVEVREGAISLVAESKLPESSTLTSGWNRDFDSVAGVLSLPPGWRIFSSSGVDWISDSWQTRWTLLDVFLVLVVSVACFRLFSPSIGLLAGCMLVLVEPEQSFSRILLLFIAFAALAAAIPKGSLQQIARLIAVGTIFVLSLQALQFSISHLRNAMFPQLENRFSLGDQNITAHGSRQYLAEIPAPSPKNSASDSTAHEALERTEMMASEAVSMSRSLKISSPNSLAAGGRDRGQQSQYLIDRNKTTQTGYGLASWSSKNVRFGWNGPVQQSEDYGFRLLSPWQNVFLAFVRVILLVLVLGIIIRRYSSVLFARLPSPRSMATSALLCVCSLAGQDFAVLPVSLVSTAQAQQEIPSSELLDNLKQFVTKQRFKPEECEPNCTSIPLVTIRDAEDGGLVISFAVHSVIPTVMPLLAPTDLFAVREISDSKRTEGKLVPKLTASGGMLWLGIDSGVQTIRLRIEVSEVEEFSIPFSTRPARVVLESEVWRSDTLRDGVLSNTTLSLRRVQNNQQGLAKDAPGTVSASAKKLDSGRLLPLFSVERTIMLGVNWTVQTRVRQISPARTATQLQVPLLPNESITTGTVEVSNAVAQVVFPAGVGEVSWESSLGQASTLELRAPVAVPWSETWKVLASNLWNIQFEGTPRIYTAESSHTGIPEWHPRPAEVLTITATQPVGIEGPTTTIDSVTQRYQVGERLQEVSLNYSVRTSKGGLQELQLPKDAELSNLTVNGLSRPVRTEDGKVKVDLAPGAQTVELRWREVSELGVLFRNVPADLGVAAVNIETEVTFPQDRWVLYLRGPLVGPVVLFWAAIPICFGVAFLLSCWPKSPLRMYEWLLLLLGLTQVSLVINLVIVVWFVLFALRAEKQPDTSKPWSFRFQQCFLALITLAAVSSLLEAIRHGLLSSPQMRIEGLRSGPYSYYWFQDAIPSTLSQVEVYSLDLFWYRGTMLLWALWLSFAAIRWMRWAWSSYTTGGYWIPLEFRKRNPKNPDTQ